MESRETYAARASEAYAKYMALQARIESIEAVAKAQYGRIVDFQLSKAEKYWVYRQLCKDRDVAMKVAEINAQMASIPVEVSGVVIPRQKVDDGV